MDNKIMEFQHKSLAAGRWAQMSLSEQMANIGSEISRALHWKRKNNEEYCRKAVDRALELIYLTIENVTVKSHLKELTRLREVILDYFTATTNFHPLKFCGKNIFILSMSPPGKSRTRRCDAHVCETITGGKMNRVLVIFCCLLFPATQAFAADGFQKFFENKTLRVDYYHSGTATREIISLDQAFQQGVWAGSRTNLVDTLNLGKYLVKVFDVATNQLIYSRGFASIYGEWETTQEALDEQARTFHESVLLPFPKRPVQVMLAKRDKWMRFQDIFSAAIDPASRFINREQRGQAFKVRTLLENGPPDKKVDFLILGDGYTKAEMTKFRKDAGYSATGLYRPAIDCRMFSLSAVPFDPVCQQGIVRVILFYSE